MQIVDTHLHLVDRRRFAYTWLSGNPRLDRDWTLDQYRTEATAAGITAALHMEVDVAEHDRAAETAWAARLPAPVIGVVAACRPESSDFAAELEAFAAIPRVRGLRRILHESPDALGEGPLFAENLRRLAPHGLTFDLCVLARQLPIAIALVDACPDVAFVLDHCGNPSLDPGKREPWRRDIAALARRPNIACKISGLVSSPDAVGWTADDLRPIVEHVISAFGWDRVVWGSDWPVSTRGTDLAAWVAATRALLAGSSHDEAARLLHRNAWRVYRVA